VTSASPQGFAVRLPTFTGPFRLLADLVLDQKVDVCDVPLAQVTDRFLQEGLEEMGGWSLEEATWFLAVCAALLELKVGRLLPRPAPETEEELLGGVSPDLLYARSLELTAFRRVAEALAERMAEAALMVPRTAGPPAELSHLYPDVMEKITATALAATAASLLASPAEVDLSHVAPIRVSLSDALQAVKDHLSLRPEMKFRDLLEGCEERIEVVVRFLAVLELYREGKVELAQARMFGDIEVRWQGTPEAASGPEREA
jgi:segregation and condensation protein A